VLYIKRIKVVFRFGVVLAKVEVFSGASRTRIQARTETNIIAMRYFVVESVTPAHDVNDLIFPYEKYEDKTGLYHNHREQRSSLLRFVRRKNCTQLNCNLLSHNALPFRTWA
jgi:hypothetical protein